VSPTDNNQLPPLILVSETNVTRAPDWRVVYCNIMGIGWGEGEARLIIGFDEDLSKPGSKVREELTVVMPHRAAKLLVHTLGAIVANFEAANGPIPIPAERLNEIQGAIKEQFDRGKQQRGQSS
jgi:hypothetical protein